MRVVLPTEWSSVPRWMSYSVLSELEACPRRWALGSAKYANIGGEYGYPPAWNHSVIEGRVVHLSLQRITRALVDSGCNSITDAGAVSTLRDLGGFSKAVRESSKKVLESYEKNPRVEFSFEKLKQHLLTRIPDLRTQVQRQLSRIRPITRTSSKLKSEFNHKDRKDHSRTQLGYGSYPEVEIRSVEIGWRGFVDLLSLIDTECEIREFKTGVPKEEHEFQIRVYATLWARDRELNPAGKIANRLVLSYNETEIEVPSPSEIEISQLEDELRSRTTEVIRSLESDPPEARPKLTNCKYCQVRHLCGEYWHMHLTQTNTHEWRKEFGDVQIRLSHQSGPSSWRGVVESGSGLVVGGPILLQTSHHRLEPKANNHLRVLNVHLSFPEEETGEEQPATVIATMGLYSEVFLL